MGTSQIWGNALWIFLHTFSEKIHDTHFKKERSVIINLIIELLYNIPCSTCRIHAIQYIKRKKFRMIQSKDELKHFFFAFHNEVNQMKNRTLFDNYGIYTTYDLQKVMSHFHTNFVIYRINKMLFIQNKKRNIAGIKMIDFVNNNMQYFT